ncbi:MAG: helix-turn-helix transcriptional regulator [Bacillota bacterium]|nr:helix-turn-helix transcriptional regulator [Bacillota bacterium]
MVDNKKSQVKKFGEKLKNLREQHGYTRNDIAKVAGIQYAAVAKWETGERLLDIFTLAKIAKFLNLSIDSILENDIQEKTIDVSDLSEENRSLVTDFVTLLRGRKNKT